MFAFFYRLCFEMLKLTLQISLDTVNIALPKLMNACEPKITEADKQRLALKQ